MSTETIREAVPVDKNLAISQLWQKAIDARERQDATDAWMRSADRKIKPAASVALAEDEDMTVSAPLLFDADDNHLSLSVSGINHADLGNLLEDKHTQYILVDGTRAFTGNQSMGTKRLTNLNTPTTAGDAIRQTASITEAALESTIAASHARQHNLLTVADHGDIATYIDQPLLTTSTPQHLRLGLGVAASGTAGEYIVTAADALMGLGTIAPLKDVGTAAGDFSGTGLHIKGTGNTRIILEGDIPVQSWCDKAGAANDKIMSFAINAGIARFVSATDANVTRIDNILVMDMGTGYIGAGIATPDSPLHIHKATAGAVAADSNAIVTIENSSNAYFHALVPDGDLGGIFVGSPASNGAGRILYSTNAVPTSGNWTIYADGVSVMRCYSTRVVVNEAGSATIDFRVESDNSEKMLFVDASADVIHVIGEDSSTVPTLDADTVMSFVKNNGAGQECYISIIAESGGASGIFFGDENTEYLGYINYNHSADTMYIGVEASTIIELNNTYSKFSGNVGIGITPTAVLHLKAGTAAASTAPLKLTTGTLLTVPEAGTVEYDGNNIHYTSSDGLRGIVMRNFFTQTSDTTVANTTVETALTGTGRGTLTLPANAFHVGHQICIAAWGFYSTATPAGTLRIKIKLGSTVILDTTADVMTNGMATQLWRIPSTAIVCRSVGASGTVMAQGDVEFTISRTGAAIEEFTPNTSPVVVDTTGALAVSITAEWGTADAGNIMTCTNVSLVSD